MRHSIYSCFLAIVLCFVANLMPNPSSAQNQSISSSITAVTTSEPSYRIDLEFGYFTCRRELFRELYGSYLDYGLNFQHRISSRWSWSLRTEFIWLHEKESPVKYWSLSETPMVIYTLSDQSKLVPVIGAGVGLTLREVVMSFARIGENEESLGVTSATQKELSAALVGMAGLDFHLSRSLVIGGRFHFDYHPFGDPSVGDFGDTGGYHFTFRLGHKF